MRKVYAGGNSIDRTGFGQTTSVTSMLGIARSYSLRRAA